MEKTGITAKRAKFSTAIPPANKGSRIFHPYRSIGHVTANVPVVAQLRGSEYFITASIGQAFQIYSLTKLRLKFVSESVDHEIVALAAVEDFTFAASGSSIVKFNRGKRVDAMENDKKSAAFKLLIFGKHLISLHDDNCLRIWDIDSCEIYAEIPFPDTFRLTFVMHPSTYLNKIVVGSHQGSMQLWNIRSMKKLYEFKSWGSPVTCLEQSPVVDVIAVGLSDGSCHLHNIKLDKNIMTLKQSELVTAISFRTDEHHFMATAGLTGDIALWNLEERALSHVIQSAHDGAVNNCMYLHGKAAMLTAGADNCLKEWMFDDVSGTPRVIKSRSGHHAPSVRVRFYDDDGKYLISAGRDKSLRLFCTFRDEQNVEFSQGSLAKKAKANNRHVDDLKFPQITMFASSTSRQNDWDNILSCHLNSDRAITWSYDRKAIGVHQLVSQDGSAIKAVAVSECGNFGYVGCTSGRVDMFNMQSGLHRRHYGVNGDGHNSSVTAIICECTNSKVITASLDGHIKVWDMPTGTLLTSLQFDAAITNLILHDGNDLLAVASDDFVIRLVDVDTMKVVREFVGHDNRILDFSFSPDGRWLISCSLDSSIRTWDIPSGSLVDAFKSSAIATSLAFSPTADFLVTTHVDSVGLSMWSNKLQYTGVSLRKLPADYELEVVDVPNASGESAEVSDLTEEDLVNYDYTSPEQLAENMITLSMEARSKWHNLLNIETIKKRNKPIAPVVTPESAPFFLPTLPGLEPKFDIGQVDKNESNSRIISLGSMGIETDFIRKLKSCHAEKNGVEFMSYMRSLSPSALDFELRTLSMEEECRDLRCLFEIIVEQMESMKDYELLQAYFNAAINIHLDVILSNAAVFAPVFTKYRETQALGWTKLDNLFQQSLCMVDFIKR